MMLESCPQVYRHCRRIFWGVAWIWAASMWLVMPARAAEFPSISLDAYWELVETTYTQLTGIANEPPETVRVALDDLALQWETVTTVELPDGTLLTVDTRYFTSQLRSENPDLGQLAQTLKTLLATRNDWSQGNFGNVDMEKLDSILSEPEFQWPPERPNPIWQFIQNLLQRITNAYVNFLDWLFPDSNGTIPVNLIFIVSGTILLTFIFIYILRGTWGNLIADTENTAVGEGDTTPLTADTARQRARDLAQAGDHRTAIRYLYLASLLLLEEKGILRYDRSLTNRETLRSVQNRPDLAVPLKDVVETFDRVWYGYQEVDQPTFEHYAERVDDLRAQK